MASHSFLTSRLRTGDFSVELLSQTEIFAFAFDYLIVKVDDIFDCSVDLVVELIARSSPLTTTRIDIIHNILNRIAPIIPFIRVDDDDSDRMRGFCR